MRRSRLLALARGECQQRAAFHNHLKKGKEMKLKPLHDRVMVQREDDDERSAGGIIIPDTAKEKPMKGKVVAVGPGARSEDGKLIPMSVKRGDVVLIGKWSGTEVKMDGNEYVIVKESDVMGIVG